MLVEGIKPSYQVVSQLTTTLECDSWEGWVSLKLIQGMEASVPYLSN